MLLLEKEHYTIKQHPTSSNVDWTFMTNCGWAANGQFSLFIMAALLFKRKATLERDVSEVKFLKKSCILMQIWPTSEKL